MAEVRLSSPPPQAGPSSQREASLGGGEILDLKVRVHQDASIFKDKKLAKDLLNNILLPKDQEK